MNAKRIALIYLLLVGLFLPACGFVPMPETTIIPTLTSTPLIATPTTSPTATPTPTATSVPPTPTLNKGIQDSESGHWYLILAPMEWENAKKYCSTLRGQLVIINNASEDSFVYNSVYKPRHKNDIFLGATDKENEKQWTWVTGEKMQYANWANHEPNNCGYFETLGKCVPENFLTYYNDPPGQWNDVSADGIGRYICEFEN